MSEELKACLVVTVEQSGDGFQLVGMTTVNGLRHTRTSRKLSGKENGNPIKWLSAFIANCGEDAETLAKRAIDQENEEWMSRED